MPVHDTRSKLYTSFKPNKSYQDFPISTFLNVSLISRVHHGFALVFEVSVIKAPLPTAELILSECVINIQVLYM